jgi:hypothetical protein
MGFARFLGAEAYESASRSCEISVLMRPRIAATAKLATIESAITLAAPISIQAHTGILLTASATSTQV